MRAWSDFQWLPGALEGLVKLNQAKARTVIVTNQQGVAKKLMTLQDVWEVHERMVGELRTRGGSLDAIYVCPHLAGTCDCRKPEAGLFEQAKRENPEIDFAKAFIVGDSESDMAAGKRSGCRTVAIQHPGENPIPQADAVAPNFLGAVTSYILPLIQKTGAVGD